MNNDIVKLTTFRNSFEANIVAEKLRCEGIECSLADENILTLAPYLDQALGSIRLLVFEKDLERARELLDPLPPESSIPDSDSDSSDRCPVCGSSNVKSGGATKGIYNLVQLLISVVLFFPIPFVRKRLHCFNCGNEYKK